MMASVGRSNSFRKAKASTGADFLYSDWRTASADKVKTSNAPSQLITALKETVQSRRRTSEAKQDLGCWKNFLRYFFGIGGHARSRIIYPESPFYSTVLLISSMLLMYTAIVVPVHIAFYWDMDVCDRNVLLEFDLAVDTFFLTEILINFFVGIFEAGIYRDDLKTVWKTYLKGQFLFDIVTSFPVSYFEFVAWQACSIEGAGDEMTTKLRITRVLKPLRLIKMLRVIKALKILEVSNYVERFIRPPPILFRLLRVLFGLVSVTHIFGCLFWLVKVISSEKAEVNEFLESNGVAADSSFFPKYILCVYFINTVFTTVGFGDISATNTAEQVACVVIMLVGVLVFGTLLSEVQAGVSELRRLSLEKGHKLHRLVRYLRSEEVSYELEYKIMSWVDFDLTCEQEEAELQAVRQSLPWSIQQELEAHLLRGFLDDIPPFTTIAHAKKDELLAALWPKLKSCTYERSFVIAGVGCPNNSLRIVVKGRVQMEDEHGTLMGELGSGHSFGEWAIMGFHPPIEVKYVALSHVHLLVLSQEDFDATVANYPADLREELAQELEERLGMMGSETSEVGNLGALLHWKKLVHKKILKEHGPHATDLSDRIYSMISSKVNRRNSATSLEGGYSPKGRRLSLPGTATDTAGPGPALQLENGRAPDKYQAQAQDMQPEFKSVDGAVVTGSLAFPQPSGNSAGTTNPPSRFGMLEGSGLHGQGGGQVDSQARMQQILWGNGPRGNSQSGAADGQKGREGGGGLKVEGGARGEEGWRQEMEALRDENAALRHSLASIQALVVECLRSPPPPDSKNPSSGPTTDPSKSKPQFIPEFFSPELHPAVTQGPVPPLDSPAQEPGSFDLVSAWRRASVSLQEQLQSGVVMSTPAPVIDASSPRPRDRDTRKAAVVVSGDVSAYIT